MSRKSKQLGLNVFDTHMGAFDYTVRCVVGNYKKTLEYVAHIYELTDPKGFIEDEMTEDKDLRGKCWHHHGYVPIIWIPRKPRTPREYATLAHETAHAVYAMFAWAHLPNSRDNEEVFGHALGHVISNILDGLK